MSCLTRVLLVEGADPLDRDTTVARVILVDGIPAIRWVAPIERCTSTDQITVSDTVCTVDRDGLNRGEKPHPWDHSLRRSRLRIAAAQPGGRSGYGRGFLITRVALIGRVGLACRRPLTGGWRRLVRCS